MPSYVNIGAYVGAGTMVDTWATVGSCAQIGRNVHLSGGVGIGGVLEPPNAQPVIIEDGAFIGSRCIVVEGTHVGKRGCDWRKRGPHRVDTDHRCDGRCRKSNARIRTSKKRRHSRNADEILCCGRISSALRIDHWSTKREHR